MPGATLQGDQYVLAGFQLFPKFQYVVENATITFNPPEGASIAFPQVGSLDQTSTLTRGTFQDTLTVAEKSISYVDYLAPQQNTIQLSYSYNPVWVSFLPTFWAALVSALSAWVQWFTARCVRVRRLTRLGCRSSLSAATP